MSNYPRASKLVDTFKDTGVSFDRGQSCYIDQSTQLFSAEQHTAFAIGCKRPVGKIWKCVMLYKVGRSQRRQYSLRVLPSIQELCKCAPISADLKLGLESCKRVVKYDKETWRTDERPMRMADLERRVVSWKGNDTMTFGELMANNEFYIKLFDGDGRPSLEEKVEGDKSEERSRSILPKKRKPKGPVYHVYLFERVLLFLRPDPATSQSSRLVLSKALKIQDITSVERGTTGQNICGIE